MSETLSNEQLPISASSTVDERLIKHLENVEKYITGTQTDFNKVETEQWLALAKSETDVRQNVTALTRWMIEASGLVDPELRRAKWVADVLDPATHDAVGKPVNTVVFVQTTKHVHKHQDLIDKEEKRKSPESKYRR